MISVAVAILTTSRSISRGLAFAIFAGTASLLGHLGAAFTTGLRAAFLRAPGLHDPRRRAIRGTRTASAARAAADR